MLLLNVMLTSTVSSVVLFYCGHKHQEKLSTRVSCSKTEVCL